MANKIIGRTDTSGAVSLGSILSNSKRPILLVGKGVDETKEIIFNIAGTKDAIKHFGEDSPFVEIVKILVRNGVKVISGINVGTYGDEGDETYKNITEAYDAAYEVSMTDKDIMIIILDTTDKDAYVNLPVHLMDAENADIYRYAIVGVPIGTTMDDVLDLASDLNCDRMMVPYPNVTNTDDIELDGIFTAAGLAAILNTETDDPALPTNNIQIVGYSGVATRYLEIDIMKLINGGVTAMYPEDAAPAIYRTVTTSQGTKGEESVWHDATTRFIADHVLATVLAKLKANYKRTKNIARVLEAIRSDIIAILDKKLAQEIIEEYDEAMVTVVKDPEDRYGALADFEYKVVSPLYTITVTQHLKI